MRESTIRTKIAALAALLAAGLANPALAQSDVEIAKLARASYGRIGPPDGWKQVKQASDPGNGFRAASYVDGTTVVVAFAGTNDPKDVLADLGIGEATFAEALAEVAMTFSASCPEGHERDGALCYPTCRDGYHSDGATLCYRDCPEGSHATPGFCQFKVGSIGKCPHGLKGLKPSCINSDSYSRGAGALPTVRRELSRNRKLPGTEKTRSQIRSAEAFYADTLAAVNDGRPKRIVITGHSLGGFLAQVIASRHGHEALTINAPGASGFAGDDVRSLRNWIRKDDVVGTFGVHVGSVTKYRNVDLDKVVVDYVLQNHKIDRFCSDLANGMKPLD
jgi:hypothetical protein